MVTDEMVEAALTAIQNKRIDARQWWTVEDKENMRTAINAAIRERDRRKRAEYSHCGSK